MAKFVGTLNIPSLSSAPGTAQDGDLYYNTSTDKVNFYNGTAWVEVGAGAGNKVYYQTSEPTGGTYATGDIWIDSDSALGGPILLTDSANSTSTTTAATPNAVLQSMKNYQGSAYASTTRVGNLPNYTITTVVTQFSGQIVATRHIAERNFTVSNLSFITGATGSSGLTLCRFGIYTRSGTTFTLVARTASDTTIFNVVNTRYTRALDTAGGYPATYDFVAGSEYWVSVIAVGTTMPNLIAATTGSTAANNAFGLFVYSLSGQTDLAASCTLSTTSNRIYSEVS